ASDIEIVGNTIADCEGPGVVVTADASEITFRNNLVLASGTEEEEAELNINAGIGVELDHVLIWGGDGPGEASGIEDLEALCPSCINADPLLLDPKGGDYRLGEGRLAIDAGLPVEGLDTDLNGHPRDELPDIGAFELGSGEPVPGDDDDDDSAADDDDSAEGDDDDSAEGDDDDSAEGDEPTDPPASCTCSLDAGGPKGRGIGLLITLGLLGLLRRRSARSQTDLVRVRAASAHHGSWPHPTEPGVST
ncbi:MAG: right-handed parallel beta-helix repeat-containing protein, partial [Myxococcota bacterium]|nr:right-handed parallel beta-helix repeat-containing protein [Myxococcota bacterium]